MDIKTRGRISILHISQRARISIIFTLFVFNILLNYLFTSFIAAADEAVYASNGPFVFLLFWQQHRLDCDFLSLLFGKKMCGFDNESMRIFHEQFFLAASEQASERKRTESVYTIKCQ